MTDLNNKSANNQRINYLDYIKAISILLVVFCHTPLLNTNSKIDNISMILCWSAVPCFFMVTGAIYLNKDLNYKKYIKKIIVTYLVMCVWKIIYILIYHFMGKIDITQINKKDIINYTFLFSGLNGVVDGHFWFIYAYISIFILYPVYNLLFKTIEKNKNFLITIMILLFISTALVYTITFIMDCFHINGVYIKNIEDKSPFGKYSFVLIYFLLGGILYKYDLYEIFKDKKLVVRLISLLCIIVGTVGLVFIKKHYSNTFEWNNIYLKDGYHWTSTILLSVGVFVFIQGVNINNNIISKILSEVGKSTMGIFYIHTLLLELNNVLKIEQKGSLINLLKTVVVIMACYIITFLIRKIPILKKLVQ